MKVVLQEKIANRLKNNKLIAGSATQTKTNNPDRKPLCNVTIATIIEAKKPPGNLTSGKKVQKKANAAAFLSLANKNFPNLRTVEYYKNRVVINEYRCKVTTPDNVLT